MKTLNEILESKEFNEMFDFENEKKRSRGRRLELCRISKFWTTIRKIN